MLSKLFLPGFAAFALCGAAAAQNADAGGDAAKAHSDYDVTMSVVEPGKGPEGVIERIPMSEPAVADSPAPALSGARSAVDATAFSAEPAAGRDSMKNRPPPELPHPSRDNLPLGIAGGPVR